MAKNGEPSGRSSVLRPTTVGLGASLALALVLLAGALFQDNLIRFTLNPRTPFQTQTPSSAPDYETPSGWFLKPGDVRQREDPAPAIFYVHSTAFYSSERWNAPADEEQRVRTVERVLLPNEAGPFATLGDVYAPKYREATLFSFFTHKFDGVAARQFAYDDVARAFSSFVTNIDAEAPIILVGYGQGGLHVLRLLETRVASDADLTARLAAAYIIDQPTPLSLFDGQLAALAPCAAPTDIRCVVSYVAFEPRFDEEITRTRRRSMFWSPDGDLVATQGKDLLCSNPLTWTHDASYTGPEKHLGAASATGIAFGSTPPTVMHAVGAACVEGVLIVDRPLQKFLRRKAWFGAKWRAADYNLFYFDLRANAGTRLERLAAVRYEEARFLDPIEASVDLEVSPVNPVPKN